MCWRHLPYRCHVGLPRGFVGLEGVGEGEVVVVDMEVGDVEGVVVGVLVAVVEVFRGGLVKSLARLRHLPYLRHIGKGFVSFGLEEVGGLVVGGVVVGGIVVGVLVVEVEVNGGCFFGVVVGVELEVGGVVVLLGWP